MSWERGRSEIERLLKVTHDLQQVVPDANLTDRLIDEATAHLETAAVSMTRDPAGAYRLAYDAARKACTALLEHQGLRPTDQGRGSHIAVQDAVTAQFNGPDQPLPFGSYSRFRHRRRTAQYPGPNDAPITPPDAKEGIETATAIVEGARRLLESDALTVFQPGRAN